MGVTRGAQRCFYHATPRLFNMFLCLLVCSVFIRCLSVGKFVKFQQEETPHILLRHVPIFFILMDHHLVNTSLYTKLHGLNKVLLSENEVTGTIVRRRSYMLEKCGLKISVVCRRSSVICQNESRGH